MGNNGHLWQFMAKDGGHMAIYGSLWLMGNIWLKSWLKMGNNGNNHITFCLMLGNESRY